MILCSKMKLFYSFWHLNKCLILFSSMFLLCLATQSCFQTPPPESKSETVLNFKMISVPSQSGWLANQVSRADYQFYLSQNEITQETYKSVMGVLPSTLKFVGADLPITNVSYYDAIIFCNALSKHEGLDSVYQYKNPQKDSLGFTYSIDDLKIHFFSNGYRLPTELEWEIAARGSKGYLFTESNDDSAVDKYSWYNLNSGGEIHPVCEKAPNANGFCDMAGNAMEWIQEYLAPIPEILEPNYAGPNQPPLVRENPVKGGSYLSSSNGLRLTGRKDTYGTYRSTKTDYLGFRIARGAILNPSFSEIEQSTLDSSPDIIASRKEIVSFFGTPFVRAIWRTATGNLQWIDWSSEPLFIRSIRTPYPAYHPAISPDGKWVAWSTRGEGQSGNSKIFIQALAEKSQPLDSITEPSAAIPRWWNDPTSQKTFLLYVTSAASNSDSNEWKQSKTFRVSVSQGKFIGEHELLSDQGAYHAGLSEDGSTLATSYTNLFSLNLESNKRSLLFLSPENGKPVQSSTQVCNASVSPQGSPQIMFLDFGSPISSTLIGKPYGIHEYIFISNNSGQINWWLNAPTARLGWDFTEWSNQSQFAIAASFSNNEFRDQIHGINVPQKTVLTLLKGVEFTHPNLWALPIASGTHLNYDSLFTYNIPSTDFKDFFEAKTRLFWKTRSNLQVALVGSSRILHGVDPAGISGKVALNMGYPGADLHSSVNQIRQYILPHAPLLETIIISLDIDLLFQRPSWFDIRIGDSPGYQYDADHHFWMEGIPPEFDAYLNGIPNESNLITPLGLGIREGRSWGYSEQLLLDKWDKDPEAWKEALDSLTNLLADLSEKGVQTYAVIFPQNPDLKKHPTPYIYGPSSVETLEKIEDSLDSLIKLYPLFKIIDFHQNGSHNFGAEYADNEDHLNIWGAEELTRRLDSILLDDGLNLPK